MKNTNILPLLWEEVKDMRVLKWLDRDLLNAIILDGDRYWYEWHSGTVVPRYVIDYFSKTLRNKGYKYLYE